MFLSRRKSSEVFGDVGSDAEESINDGKLDDAAS